MNLSCSSLCSTVPVVSSQPVNVQLRLIFPVVVLRAIYTLPIPIRIPICTPVPIPSRRRFKSIVRFCEPLYRERLRDSFLLFKPDVIVSVHPLLNHAALRARSDAGINVPIVTVITDLGRVHEAWLMPEADAVVVPAPEVYQRALERGVSPDRLRLLGHPVHPKFEDVSQSKEIGRAHV